MDIWDLLDTVRTELSGNGNGIINAMAVCKGEDFFADLGINLDVNNPDELQAAWTLLMAVYDLQDIKERLDYCCRSIVDTGTLEVDEDGNCSLHGEEIPDYTVLDVLRESELINCGVIDCHALSWIAMRHTHHILAPGLTAREFEGFDIEPQSGMFIRIREDKETEC